VAVELGGSTQEEHVNAFPGRRMTSLPP
jgi:hypothetical protein